MSRIRTLKPDHFMDEALAEVSIPAHFLLSGLWTLADREGRLEDRPRYIKAHVFPYREVDVEPLLAELFKVRRIIRYEVGGVRYIEVTNWARDQRPHVREAPSTIPGSAHAQPRQCHGTTQANCLPTDVPASASPGLLGSGNRDLGIGIHVSASQEPAGAASVADDIPQAADEDVEAILPTGMHLCRGGCGHLVEKCQCGRPALVLVAQKPEKAARKPSKAEELYANFQAQRRERCEEAGVHWLDDGWKPQRVNAALGPLVRLDEAGKQSVADGWEAYLADDAGAVKDPPWSLGYFLASRSSWESRAARRAP